MLRRLFFVGRGARTVPGRSGFEQIYGIISS
jgi:hypothetical protein